jgi:Raf kinase inhibitor-like YbhB/YbcL family protein
VGVRVERENGDVLMKGWRTWPRRYLTRLAAGLVAAALLAACDTSVSPTSSLVASMPSSPSAQVQPSAAPGDTSVPATDELPGPSEEAPIETGAVPGTSAEDTPDVGPTGSEPAASFDSPEFRGAGRTLRIPPKYTCDGNDVSPPLEWRIPGSDQIAELAVVVSDPDARNFTHWVVARIPGGDTVLDEGAGDPTAGNGLLQGQNSFGSTGYQGPCPPAGTTHHYRFALYAFATAPTLSTSPTADDIRRIGGTPVIEFEALFGH